MESRCIAVVLYSISLSIRSTSLYLSIGGDFSFCQDRDLSHKATTARWTLTKAKQPRPILHSRHGPTTTPRKLYLIDIISHPFVLV